MSVDIELQTVSSFITKNELNELLKGNQDEIYAKLNEKLRKMRDSQDGMIEALKDEVMRMRIDQNNKMDTLMSFMEETFTLPTQKEEPSRRHEKTQQMREMLYISSPQRRDIFVSQREEDGVKHPKEDSSAPPPSHTIDISLGK